MDRYLYAAQLAIGRNNLADARAYLSLAIQSAICAERRAACIKAHNAVCEAFGVEHLKAMS